MNARSRGSLCMMAGTTIVLGFVVGLSAVSPVVATGETKENKKAAVAPPDEGKGVTVAEARERAKLMHNIFAATLDVMHHHFFKRDRAVLPARAMEDVFAQMDKQSNIKAGWISVNTKAMSIHHEPKNDFEKQAAKAAAAGKGDYADLVDP